MLHSIDPGWPPPVLPEPYLGDWELWVSAETGEVVFVVLNVRQFDCLALRFVRAFHCTDQDSAIEEAAAWVDGAANTEVFAARR